MSTLTPKQGRFVAEYLVDLNATQAAIRAGFSEKTAAEQGHQLLQKTSVAEAIAVAMAERGQRTKVTADRTLLELERLAMVDVSEFASVKSPADLAAMPADRRRAVVGWSWDKRGNFVLRFAKAEALALLGRHHRLFTEVVEVKGLDGLAQRLAKARLRIAAGKEVA